MRALSFFGRPSAAKQESRRGEREERRNGIGMGCVCTAVLSCLGRSACRVSPSSHAQALSPGSSPSSLHLFLRSRRLPCPAAACCSPRSSVLLSSRETSYYTGAPSAYPYAAQIRSPSPSPSPSKLPLLLQAVSHAAISGSHSIRQRGKVKPSATCHRPPTPSLFARFPEPGRRCLNLISARRSAPIRPKNSPARCTASLCRSQPIVPPLLPCFPPNALADPI